MYLHLRRPLRYPRIKNNTDHFLDFVAYILKRKSLKFRFFNQDTNRTKSFDYNHPREPKQGYEMPKSQVNKQIYSTYSLR